VNWLNSLPQPVYDDIKVGAPVGAAIRTKMEHGPAKQRRRFTAAPQPVSLTFAPITEAVLGEFEAFYRDDLSFGVLAFEMEHPVTGLARQFRFNQDGEPWQFFPIGDDAYQLGVELELLP
jgi:hypothetical protein